MGSTDRDQLYESLVRERKLCRACVPDLVNPADPTHAHFDGSEIGPWTLWLAARPARLLVVGQDWGTVEYFRRYGGRDVPTNLTNKRLVQYLAELGAKVPDVGEATDHNTGVFLTNAILCLKQGDTLSAPVKGRWFRECASFLRKTIMISGARVTIGLGVRAYEAVARAFALRPLPLKEAVNAASPLTLPNDMLVFAVFHPAARPKDRTREQQRDDWRRISAELSRRGIALW